MIVNSYVLSIVVFNIDISFLFSINLSLNSYVQIEKFSDLLSPAKAGCCYPLLF